MPRAVVVWREQSTVARPMALAPHAVVVVVAGPRGRAAAVELHRALPTWSFVVLDGDAALPAAMAALCDLTALDTDGGFTAALQGAKRALFRAQQARVPLLAAAAQSDALYLAASACGDGTDPARAVAASVSGLVKTAALEWPGVRCASVDCDGSTSDGAVLAQELAAGLPDVEVRLQHGLRTVPVVLQERAGHGALQVGADDVLLCSGGARGVTATTLLALARAAQPRLVLLGRTRIDVPEPACAASAADEPSLKRALLDDARSRGAPLSLPSIAEEARRILAVREIAAFVSALEAAGSAVHYAAVDVRDAAAVRAVADDVRGRWGAITGVVHGAGVLADKRIEDKTQEQVDRVMDTKVLGLHALLGATDQRLRMVLLFSSVAGRYGNIGQVDYAMANEALSHVARGLQAERPALVVKSMMWGPWEGGMVTPALKAQFLQRGVQVLSAADGARHFVDELRRGTSICAEVVYGGQLLGAADANANNARFVVDEGRFPMVSDHAIADVPVLPVVLALELMLRTRRATALEDVRVLKGVRLPRFAQGGHTLTVVVDEDHTARLFADDARQPSYSARLVESTAPPRAFSRGDLEPYAFSRAHVYQSLLFHGPRFQLIDDVLGVADAGLLAQVHGVRAAGFALPGAEPFVLDVGALDAALQATLLWARHATGGAYLPTSLARLTIGEGVSDGPYRCVVQGRGVPDLVAEADVLLLNERGAVAYRLDGVHVHRLPDDAAFSSVPTLAGASP